MWKEHTILYESNTTFENEVAEGYWQFLIIPMENEFQEILEFDFSNSTHCVNQLSINGFGFKTIKVHPKKAFSQISFKATFRVRTSLLQMPEPTKSEDILNTLEEIGSLKYKVHFERFLRATPLTGLPKGKNGCYQFDPNKGIFENLVKLNLWIHSKFQFASGAPEGTSRMETILDSKLGNSKDLAHLFCTVGRNNNIPCRYISGFVNRENGSLGDGQIHAWAEAFVPGYGWLGFDPTNNRVVNADYIKICHGKDSMDCLPEKRVIHSAENHITTYSVVVKNQQRLIQQ
ncbi:transglutaminase-like domain-containing protein [Maribacter flavus]|uniref:Transglutaminase domain-containing protein n=1 Tax=Maribacter flavus TaxID=1658664 RepID=A0A5B2TU61_9FLAO|nr:transglutaminase-like domain-containing protein [Maribacter flavus]KAA2217335.1 transglutaminase domain-containing protein [Maribacter flavus]